jgi:hypothetical protein
MRGLTATMTNEGIKAVALSGRLQGVGLVRGEVGFPLDADVVEGRDEAVRVPDLGIVLQFSEVYADLEET